MWHSPSLHALPSLPERKDETRLCPGGDVRSLRGRGASGLVASVFLSLRGKDRERKRVRRVVEGGVPHSFDGACSTSDAALFQQAAMMESYEK